MVAHAGICGWGYEGQSADDLLGLLRARDARAVVDLRLNAVSRKRGFSKRALSSLLTEAGFRYLHLPALGNPRDNRPGFATPGSPEARSAHARFVEEVLGTADAQVALAAIGELSEEGPVVLLCYESDERCCHRSLVLDAIAHHGREAGLLDVVA